MLLKWDVASKKVLFFCEKKTHMPEEDIYFITS